VNIDLPLGTPVQQVTIYNYAGQAVWSAIPGGYKVQLDISGEGFKNGFYMVEVTYENDRSIERLVVSK
jgi:hypothetical protein